MTDLSCVHGLSRNDGRAGEDAASQNPRRTALHSRQRKHEASAKSHQIEPIDLVVVNLYPFEETVARPGVTLPEAIENIDIGGPSMLRSAAKNHESVTVVVDPEDYAEVAGQISETGGTTPALRRKLAAKVFARTAAYDAAITSHLAQAFEPAAPAGLPATLSLHAPRASAQSTAPCALPSRHPSPTPTSHPTPPQQPHDKPHTTTR